MSEETTLLNDSETTETVEKTEEITEVVQQTVETTPKPEDSKTDEVVVGAPEKYEDFQLPDGIELDTEALESFIPIAKDLNLTQDKAQKLVDYEAKRVQEFIDVQQESWQDMQKEWRASVKADKELGGPAFDQSLADANIFINKYGTPELREALNSTGIGNHPEFIRAFSRAGKAMGEDKLTTGDVSNMKKSPEDILFPNQSSI